MRRALFVLLSSIALLSVSAPFAFAQAPPQARRLDRLEQWLEALVHHVPGERDEVILEFASWTAPHWEMLVTDVQVFTRLTIHPEMPIAALTVIQNGQRHPIRTSYSSAERQQMYTLACAFTWSPAANCLTGPGALEGDLQTLVQRATAAHQHNDHHYVLRLAALLHSDLAMRGITQDTSVSVVSGTTTRLWMDADDGQGANIRRGGVQWQLAYSVLDPILDENLRRGVKPRDPWVKDWYSAIAAWMQEHNVYDQAHIDHALSYFPDDPDLHFWSATLHEIDAGPILQHSLKTITLPRNVTTTVDKRGDELRAARRDLNRTLSARPEWPEARLRLGWIHAQLGEWREAARELRLALGKLQEPELEYLAAMFLGAVEEQAARFDDAKAFYQQASEHFPEAQSPYLALSQLARRRGDRNEAQRQMHRVFALEGARGDDPWWSYLKVQARASDARFDALSATLFEVPK